MKFLFLESFYAGSHALFSDELCKHSSHEIDLITMPGEYWRWRMLGSALYFSQNMPALSEYDGIIVTDLFNLADFLALTGADCPPVLAYFHENQITYPPPPGDKHAFQIGMINITTAMTADRVVFNSSFHKNAFIDAVAKFLQKGRDFRPEGVAESIREKASVLYPGITIPALSPSHAETPEPPLIIWNHRWAFDKNYKNFFNVLYAVADKGIDFRLALLGENFGRIPNEFSEAAERLEDKVVQFGVIESRREYIEWLHKGDIVISTAIQENFGISVAEAVLCGCVPLVPNRLSYPELISEKFHEQCIYANTNDLIARLTGMLNNFKPIQDNLHDMPEAMNNFLWQNLINDYDEELEKLALLKK